MNRLDLITKHLSEIIRHGRPGLEIAPWHSPILPKSRYPAVLTVDMFPHDVLVKRAQAAIPPIPDEKIAYIEPVDFVGDASRLLDLVPDTLHGKLAFIISSHNFEHLPDAVRFLRDGEKILADDGVLVMAIPDKRGCFDHWRPASTTGQLVEAYMERRSNPSLSQRIDHVLGRAYIERAGQHETVFSPSTPECELHSDTSAFAYWRDRLATGPTAAAATSDEYISAHCWTFTPESFALVLHDLISLELVQLYPLEISSTQGAEFFVHLSKRKTQLSPRSELCRRTTLADSQAYYRATDNPRRYRRLYAIYMSCLNLIDGMVSTFRIR